MKVREKKNYRNTRKKEKIEQKDRIENTCRQRTYKVVERENKRKRAVLE